MRRVLFCGLLAAGLLAFQRPGLAYVEGPWCLMINAGSGGGVQENCSMPSFEACRQEAMVYGSSTFCRINGAYQPPKGKSRAHPKNKHRS